MNNLEFRKKRDFGDLLSDSIQFLSKNFISLITNFFSLAAIPLVIILIGVFLIFSNVFNIVELQENGLEQSFQEFIPIIIGGFLTFIGSIAIYPLMYFYIPFFMKIYDENNGVVEFNDLLNSFKNNIGNIVLFLLASFLIYFLLIIPIALTALILIITIIGPFLLLYFIQAVFQVSLFNYINNPTSITDAYKKGYANMKTNFWQKTFAFLLLGLIIFVVSMILQTFIFAPISLLNNPFINPDDVANAFEDFNFEWWYILLFILYFMSVMICSFIPYILSGFIYYGEEANNTDFFNPNENLLDVHQEQMEGGRDN